MINNNKGACELRGHLRVMNEHAPLLYQCLQLDVERIVGEGWFVTSMVVLINVEVTKCERCFT